MADVSPGGKRVGMVNIRVVPDTSDFKKLLDVRLGVIERETHFTVNVDKANLNRIKIRNDINSQMSGLDSVEVDASITAIVDKVAVKKLEVRKDLQRQFDEMGLKVKIGAELRQAERDIENFVDKVNRQQGSININAATAAATAQMRWLSRDRYITLIPEISKTALAKVTTQLLALSGIRVAKNWATDIIDAVGNIDKNLPTIANFTALITTLVSVLLASVSGILGLGAGLASIVPTLLILPGLLIGTGFAITTLVVAMKVGKKELDALADPMNELASIIQDTYWDAARDPIVSLITTLMPQLRVAFGETAAAMGRFTGAFAEAFENELSEGRLMPLFDGISRSFDILATGADAFAGAIVSLSAIAAKYVPRLAQWFVDISIDFDNWLNDVANDGRMDEWFERGIKAIKDTGRAVNGMARQFAALWKAAEAGGSGGLVGFADAMQRYAEIMESSKFQSTMTAIFRGASDGTKSLADGLSGLGNMFHYLEDELTLFLGGMGEIVGVFLEDFADAFSSPEAAKGLTDFTEGLVAGFAEFGEYMPSIADGISELGSLAGDLGETLGPILGATLAGLSEALGPFLKFLREEILPTLGPVVVQAIKDLTPVVGDLLDVLKPVLEYLVELAALVIPELVVVIDFIANYVDFDLIAAVLGMPNAVNNPELQARLDAGDFGSADDNQILQGYLDWNKQFQKEDKKSADEWDKLVEGIENNPIEIEKNPLPVVSEWFGGFLDDFLVWRTDLYETVGEWWDGLWGGLSGLNELMTAWFLAAGIWIAEEIAKLGTTIGEWWDGLWGGLTDFGVLLAAWGIRANLWIATETAKLGLTVAGWWDDLWGGLTDIGGFLLPGFRSFGSLVASIFVTMVNNLIGSINKLLERWNDLPFVADVGLIGRIYQDIERGPGTLRQQMEADTPGLATGGTVVSRGQVLVGELGPELLTLNKGASVIPLDRVGLNSGKGSGTINYYAAPNVSIDSEEALFTAMRRAKVIGW